MRHGDTEINVLTERIIGRAIEVHRVLGPGLLEPVYEAALRIELDDAQIPYARQKYKRAHDHGPLVFSFLSRSVGGRLRRPVARRHSTSVAL